jgi:transmembrane sensor
VAPGAVAAALAACLVILLAPTLQLRLDADYRTGIGETREVVLKDGSRIHLDARSAVALDYGPARRTVRLIAGQAFFDVAPVPARPFVVPAEGLTVTVTATGFAVGSGGADTSVAVQLGSVEVAMERPGGGIVRLAPGHRLTLAHATGTVTRSRVPPADVAAWREGRLVVDGMPLAELAARLGRYHRGVIWVRSEGLAERRITGVFNLTDPVAALRAAAATQGAEVMAFTPYLLVVTGP